MRIAVIGTGNIGRTLGGRWRAAGHDVVYGSRERHRCGGPDGAPAATPSPGPWRAPTWCCWPCRAARWPAWSAPTPRGPGRQGDHRRGQPHRRAGVQQPRRGREGGAHGARYVRAFNTLGWENFAEPPAGAALFYAADPAAREAAEELIRAVGLGPQFVGGPDAAKTVDGVLPLWFSLVQQHGGNRKLAFRVVRS